MFDSFFLFSFYPSIMSLLLLLPALPGSNHINKVVSHPTLPVTITAHEDRHIKFYDNKSGQSVSTCQSPAVSLHPSVSLCPLVCPFLSACLHLFLSLCLTRLTCVACLSAGKVIHAMVAHLDAVTSLAVDPNGIYLMSGSESL